MRNYYRTQRDTIISCIRQHPYYDRVTIKEENAGLHFLLEVDTAFTDQELIKKAHSNGIHVSCLSEYYSNRQSAILHTLILNYSGLEREKIEQAIEMLFSSF